MTRADESSPTTTPAAAVGEWDDVRVAFESREVGRRLEGLRLTQAGLKWVGLPALAAVAVFLLSLLAVGGAALGDLWGLVLGLLVAGGYIFKSYRKLSEHTSELEAERERLIALRGSDSPILPRSEASRSSAAETPSEAERGEQR